MRLYPKAVNQFLDDPASGLTTEATKKTYKTTLRALQFAYPDHQVGDFTEDELAAFCSKPNLAPATRATYRTRLHGFYSWAKWRGIVDDDPTVNLKRIVGGSYTKPVKEHNWLTTQEVARVFERIDTTTPMGRRNMIIARLGFTVGLRRAEIAGLRWGGVNLDRQEIRVVGKGDKMATMYITDGTLPWIQQWHDEAVEGLGRPVRDDEPVVPAMRRTTDFKTGYHVRVLWSEPLSKDMISKLVATISEEASIQFSPHDMRRSFANMLEENEAGVEEISAALRHSNLGTTQRYLEKRQDASYQAVKKRGLSV